MNLCIGERIDNADWPGLALGRFAPQGHGAALPVAAAQDTLFIWKNGSSSAQVRSRGMGHHYARHERVLDFMAKDEEAFITHDSPETAGECLLVAVPPEIRESLDWPTGQRPWFQSRFDFIDPFIYESARVLERECRSGAPGGRLLVESISTALVAYLVAAHAANPNAKPVAGASRGGPGRLSTGLQARLVRYVDEHLAENIGLNEMAQQIGKSPAQFMRLFTRTFAESPHRFVLNRRIEKAKWLLRTDRHSVADISADCGFSSPSHFASAFRTRTGTTPGQFRMDRRQRLVGAVTDPTTP